eukprot:492053_1
MMFSSWMHILLLWFCQSLTPEMCGEDACLCVTNSCDNILYMQRLPGDGPDIQPKTVHVLHPKRNITLNITDWISSTAEKRLYAWWVDPRNKTVVELNPLLTTGRDKIEFSTPTPTTIGYDITAVDYIGLPVNVAPYNSNVIGETCHNKSSGGISIHNIKSECPVKYTYTPPYGVCNSPFYCINNSTFKTTHQQICNELSTTLQKCKTKQICGSTLSLKNLTFMNGWCDNTQNREWCAAIHRGVFGNKSRGESITSIDFYKYPPYNSYAKWIHNFSEIYAFPEDDDGAQGGFQTCNTNIIKVEYCP